MTALESNFQVSMKLDFCVHTGTQLICRRSASAKHSYLPARLTYEIPLMRRSHVEKTAACLLWFLHKGIVSQRESKRERERAQLSSDAW